MTPRKPRGLRPDEQELWEIIRQNTVPLHRPGKNPLASAVKKIAPTPEKPPIQNFQIGQNAYAKTYVSPGFLAPPLNMDARKFGRLKKGKVAPEARIDLHGMTLAHAHPVLIGFVLNAHSNGQRLVLVITGKGRGNVDNPAPYHAGVLKRQVPEWLRQGPLAPVVQQVTDAHAKHGGGGALYVYLRRIR